MLVLIFAFTACASQTNCGDEEHCPDDSYGSHEPNDPYEPSPPIVSGRTLAQIRQSLETEFYVVATAANNGYQMLTAKRDLSWVVVIQFSNNSLASLAEDYWKNNILQLKPNAIPELIEFERDGRNLIFTHNRVWFQTTLPVLRIGMAMEEIDRNVRDWTTASITGIECQDFAEIFEFANVAVEVRGRGQSSWRMSVGNAPYAGKRPFRMRFPSGQPRSILDSGFAAREWTFIANQSDKSLMRNYSAYYLGRLLDGMPFAPNAQLIHVYMNGVYQGIYQMSDQNNQPQPGRVDIITNNNPQISEFLFEMCRHEIFRWRNPDHYTSHPDYPRPHIILNENAQRERPFQIEAGGRAEGHADFYLTVAYAQTFLQNVDDALRSQNFNQIARWIDIPSFIDYYLVQELYKNIDVNTSSARFTIRGQGESRRLYAGPVWDFDIAAGNAYYQPGLGGYSPQGEWVTYRCDWFRDLLAVPSIRTQIRTRWTQIKNREVRQALDRLDFMADTYAYCFDRNFGRWQIMNIYVWPNPSNVWNHNSDFNIRTHRGQVDFLIDWLEQRGNWMSSWF